MTMTTTVTAMPPAPECLTEPSRRTEEDRELGDGLERQAPSTPGSSGTEDVSEDVKLPSVGSARHGGSCLPCAWFWKPQGCLNGDACLRCHLCPAGELKRRKGEQKAKRALAKEAEVKVSVEPELPSVGSKLHAAGQCKPCAWFWKADGCRNGASCGHCHMCPAGEAKARKQAKVAAIRAKGSVTGGTGETEAEPVMQPVQVMPAPVVYQAMVPQYPTLLTPWRQAGACPGCVCCTNCVPHTVPRAPCVAYFQVPPTAPVTSNCEAGDRRTLQELQSPVWAVTPVTSLPKVAPSLPSKGSALHADGRCSPCAWFWKPQGCHHGEECGRCHLCPASEIKVRRKAKAMAKDAMRAEQSTAETLILD
ncbi:unnamed protein product [Durusdinium trenchii]|uniref:C3H1-type domain-containing protein n=1 Tax=Durusdinium trenchii TaxID=1381693 RepID=A0ABP0PBA3_9DINO